MKQLKMTALAIALSTAAASSAMAQSTKTNAWEGFYGQASVGFAAFSPQLSGTSLSPIAPYAPYYSSAPTGPISVSTSTNTLNTATNALGVGYNFGINESYVLGLGANYTLSASSAGSGSFTLTAPGNPALPVNTRGGPINATAPISYQLKNIWSVAAYPGYVIDKDRLAYAKIGYTGITIGINSATAPYQTTNLSGYVLGLGYKQMVSQSVYVLGEVNYAGISTKAATLTSSYGTFSSNVGGSGYDFLVGVGYRF